MTPDRAKEVLRCCPPGGEDDDDRLMRAARRVAHSTPEVKAAFLNQLAFDRVAASQMEVIVPPETAAALAEYAEKLAAHRRKGMSLRDPALLTVAAAVLFLVGLLVWLFLGRAGGFSGMQEVAEVAIMGNQPRIQKRFEPLSAKAGTLADWFMLKGFNEYSVPSGFEDYEAVGVCLVEYQDVPVAIAAVPVDGRKTLFFSFESSPLGVHLPEDGSWKVTKYDSGGNRVLAARRLGSKCFLVAFDGTEAEMRNFLATHSDRMN